MDALTPSLLVQVIIAVITVGGAWGGAVVAARATRKGQSEANEVNARKVATEQFQAYTTTVQADNDRLRAERAVDHLALRTLEKEVRDLHTDRDAMKEWIAAAQKSMAETAVALQLHAAFDAELIRRLRGHGETDLPDPPPLVVPAPPPPPL